MKVKSISDIQAEVYVAVTNICLMAGSADVTKQIGSFKFTVMTVSKWLDESEKSVFCNVTETGDILEVEHKDFHHWGIGIRTTASSKYKNDGMLEKRRFGFCIK
jgi:hypothetical protein